MLQITRRRTPWKVASLAVALGLVLTACGDGDNGAIEDATNGDADDEALGEDEVAEADDEVETDESAFYYNEEIEILAPFAAGGGTDAEARFMAPYLVNTIPGPPSTVGVFNIAGAGGTIGNNEWWNGRDHEEATSLLYSSASSFFPWIFGEPALDLDYAEMQGVFGSQVGAVVYVNPDETGIESTEDFIAAVQDDSVSFVAGEQTPDSLGLVFMLAYELLGMDHDVIMGYEGRGPARVSFEQAELNINWDTSPSWTNVEELVDGGTAVPVFTIGQVEDGELGEDPFFGGELDLPNFAEVYEEINGEAPSGELYEAFLSLVNSGLTLQKVMWLHNDAPDEAVEEMLQAFEDMVNDPEFDEEATEVLGDYPKIVGDEVLAAVEDLVDFPDDQRDLLVDWMVENYDYAPADE